METDIDAVDNCLVIGDDSRQSVSCNNAVAIVMTSVSDCSVVSLSNGDVDGCCCSSSMELHHEDAEVGQPPKVTEPRIPDDEPAPNPPPPMTTEQWLDSLHRRKKFRSSATVGLSDADRSRLFAHGGVQSPADGSVRLPTPVDATSWHQMAGVCGHGDLQPETGDWIAINMNDSTSQSSISLATTTGTTSPDADRLSVERRRGGTAATPKPTSFFSRFRRAMVSGFGSLLGINTADDNHSTKSKTPTADFAAAAIAAPYSVATIGRGGNQQQPRNGTNSVIARLTADGIINSEEYDRMTELEKLAVLAEKMALDKQKALVTAACTTSSSCHQQSLVEHGSAPPSSFDIHANSASAFDSVDDSFGSLRRVPRSKSCHSMGTGNRLSVASSKFPMTPTSPVEFDDIVTRFASVKLARDDAPSATSLQSNSNSIIDSLTPATPDGGSVDSCLRQKPAGESEEDSRRISTTSSLSSSSCSSGYGSLRRAKPSAVPRGSQRLSTAGVSASAHAISCNLASHSLADVDRLSTSPLGPVGENSAMPPVVESRVTHGDRTAKCSAKEVEHERRRAMPSDNSFTSYDTTSKASRALAVQFHKAQQRRAQSLIVDSADDRVPAHSDQRKVDEPAPPAADETGRIQRGRRPKTPPKPPPSRIRARTSCVVPAGNGSPAHPVVCSTDGNEGLEGLSQRPWSLQEISAIIEKELKANENIQQTIEGIDGGRIREQLQSSVARSTSGRPTAVIGSTPRERSFAKRLETNSGRIGGKSHGIETTFDDDDLGVDVNDDDEDATSTSTLTDETITQSTSTINRRSESSSSTTLEISSDDFDRLFPSQRQLELTMLRSNCDSVSSSGGEQSSFEFTQMQRKNLTLRPTPPSNGLHFQSSSSAIFDEFCVAFGGSLPASCRRAATGATNDRLLSPRASSSLTVGVSTCRGSDVTEADCNGDDEAGQHSNRRLVRPTKLALDEVRN